MKENLFGQKDISKIIETIRNSKGSETSFCVKRGGLINSMILNRKEILYLDEETFKDENINVRGGIPILFPNAGSIKENSLYPNLPQHGFARNMKWQKESIPNGFKETLLSNEETRKMFPFDFRFSIIGQFESDGSLTLIEEIENKEKNIEMPIAMGLHPYFKVLNKDKNQIQFDFEGGKQVTDQIEKWTNEEYISIDNPKTSNPDAVIKLIIPKLGTIVIDPSIKFEKIWFWSIPEQDFICVEPIMKDINGLVDNPQLVKPGQIFYTNVNFKLE